MNDPSRPEPAIDAPAQSQPAGEPDMRIELAPSWLERTLLRLRDYFTEEEPRFWQAMLPFVLASILLFTRLPMTNYIFDEQEALLANPYVNAAQKLRFVDAIHRDFWGLPADRSVGSYRPIPNFLWRVLWQIPAIGKQPFFHHFYNVLLHAANAAAITCLVWLLTRQRSLAWITGAVFCACAVLTEAVSGIVGIADVLGGLGAILALLALLLPAWIMPVGVFAALSFGLFSKESALVCVPLVPLAALVLAPLTHPKRPMRVPRMVLALIASVAAFVVYVELRRRWFLSPTPSELTEPLPDGAGKLQHLVRSFLLWFHQAPLPKDPLNNPLAEADVKHRVAGALRVYWRGLTQVVFPRTLSGDYSYPQEPIPDKLVFPESVLGAAMTALPPLATVGLWIGGVLSERRARRATHGDDPPPASAGSLRWMRPAGAALLGLGVGAALIDFIVLRPRGAAFAWKGLPVWVFAGPLALVGIGFLVEGGSPTPTPERSDEPVPIGRAALLLCAVGLTWIVVSYFPHSNIPVVLPTVRAERFWYFPAIGSCLVIGSLFAWLLDAGRSAGTRTLGASVLAAFLAFQGVQAYRHAMDYRDDLAFWEATKKAVPNSAKAHLNYSVMKGARGNLPTRLYESKEAMRLAPKWPMAHVYTGDTLCRMHRSEEAWRYYEEGFDLGPNELSLIALGLQCLYDEGHLTEHAEALRRLADDHPGSWIAYLAIDTLDNGEKNKGVDPKYRPRGYNEGPKDE